MSMSSVLLISVAAGLILVVGGGLMMYMAGLVKNAYELKVQINNDIDERLTKMGEELDKKSRWIKRDLLEEIEKIKTNLESDSARRFGEMTDPVNKRLDELMHALQKDHADWTKAVAEDRDTMAKLEGRIGQLRRDAKTEAAKPGSTDAALDAAAAALDAKAAQAAPATADGTAAPPPAAAPEVPKGPPVAKSMTGFLPDLGARKV
jgi:transposase